MDLNTPEARVRAALDDMGLGDGDCRRILNAMQPQPTDQQLDLPFREMDPNDATAQAGAHRIREALQLPGDTIVADTAVVKAITLDAGPFRIPAVLGEYSLGIPGAAPLPVGQVLYLGGDPDQMRKFGVLVRDCANGAANAARS